MGYICLSYTSVTDTWHDVPIECFPLIHSLRDFHPWSAGHGALDLWLACTLWEDYTDMNPVGLMALGKQRDGEGTGCRIFVPTDTEIANKVYLESVGGSGWLELAREVLEDPDRETQEDIWRGLERFSVFFIWEVWRERISCWFLHCPLSHWVFTPISDSWVFINITTIWIDVSGTEVQVSPSNSSS